MLADHGQEVERHAADFERRQELAGAFGNWIAYQLGPWDWFINPISFRDRQPDLERNPKTGLSRSWRITGRAGSVSFYTPDPRIKAWKPTAKYQVEPGPPVPDVALAEIGHWLCELQEVAGQPIKTMVAEEFGRISGRYHCHLLVGGVAHLRRDESWREAFDRFGRTRIEPFDPKRGAAFYCAKYAAKKIGALHFLGAFPGVDFSAILSPGEPIGREDVVVSAAMPRSAYRLSFENCFGARWRQRGKGGSR